MFKNLLEKFGSNTTSSSRSTTTTSPSNDSTESDVRVELFNSTFVNPLLNFTVDKQSSDNRISTGKSQKSSQENRYKIFFGTLWGWLRGAEVDTIKDHRSSQEEVAYFQSVNGTTRDNRETFFGNDNSCSESINSPSISTRVRRNVFTIIFFKYDSSNEMFNILCNFFKCAFFILCYLQLFNLL